MRKLAQAPNPRAGRRLCWSESATDGAEGLDAGETDRRPHAQLLLACPKAHLDLGASSAGAALLVYIQLLGEEHPEEGAGQGERKGRRYSWTLGCISQKWGCLGA